MERKEDYREMLFNDELCILAYLDRDCKGEFVTLTSVGKALDMETWTLSRIFNRYFQSTHYIAHWFGYQVSIKRGIKGNIVSVGACRHPSFHSDPYNWYNENNWCGERNYYRD